MLGDLNQDQGRQETRWYAMTVVEPEEKYKGAKSVKICERVFLRTLECPCRGYQPKRLTFEQ